MKDRIVVSGGAGFVGSHLTEALSQDSEVVVLDNFSSGSMANLAHASRERVHIVNGDIRDFRVAKSALRKAKAVFHEAAVVSVTRSIQNPTLTNDVNVSGTLNLLLAAVANKVPWFINASSSSVYGEATIPGGTVRYEGTARALYGGVGDGRQILVANPFIYASIRWVYLPTIFAEE